MTVEKRIEEYKATYNRLGKYADEMEHGEGRSQMIASYRSSLHKKEKEMATWMHETYEELAKGADWKTQESCQVEFDKLPEENKRVMIGMAKRILGDPYLN